MATLQSLALDKKQARLELKAFRSLLDGKGKGDLSESKDILPFFTSNKQLCVLMGSYNPLVSLRGARIAREFDIFGDHIADLAIGDTKTNQFCFIEFEDASSSSIFKQGTKKTPEWSVRYEHGCSQLIDWILWIDNNKNTMAHQNRFGVGIIDYNMILIIGRDRDLTNQGLKERFEWRNSAVVVHSKKIHCRTFDQLYNDLQTKLQILG